MLSAKTPLIAIFCPSEHLVALGFFGAQTENKNGDEKDEK